MLNRILEAVRKALRSQSGERLGEKGRIRPSSQPSSCEHLGEQGFTLIELIMVIVILGILAAAAVPKFMDLSGDAKKAAVKGVASSLEGAGSANFAACKVLSSKCKTGAACTTTWLANITEGGVPVAQNGTQYTIAQVSAGSTTTDVAFICSVTDPTDATATRNFSLLPT